MRIIRRKVKQGNRPPRYSRPDITGWKVAPGVDPRLLVEKAVTRRRSGPLTIVPASISALDPREMVIGLTVGGSSRAYPVVDLATSHVVNDVLEGTPVVVTFCARCHSGGAFGAVVDGRPSTFEMYGVYQGTFVMRDLESLTLWSHLTGEALFGENVGRRLEWLPTTIDVLADWGAEHPAGTIAELGSLLRTPVVPGIAELDPIWRRTVSSWDSRLPERALVLGLIGSSSASAYSVDGLRAGPRVREVELDETPMVIYTPLEGYPRAYKSGVDGDLLQFGGDHEHLTSTDGTTWTGGGRGIAGPRAGQQLSLADGRVSEWYAWSASFPDSKLDRGA